MDITGLTFKKVSSATINEGFTYTSTDYIADVHLLNYVIHQNSIGWTIQTVEDDDRPDDADRSYNPPAYLTGDN